MLSRVSPLLISDVNVKHVSILTDRDTGRSRGCGFVEIPNDVEAAKAVSALRGREFDGRSLTVNEAPPKEDRGSIGGAFRANSGGYRRKEARG
jgi:cold-inducible RNA-binding protein